MNLELTQDLDGIGLTVLNDKEVRYTQPSGADITNVNIFFNDKLLISTNVEVAH